MVRSAPRAVGQACGANRIALVIPCHRVVGAMGALGGFMNARDGDPMAIKRWLLVHEGYVRRALPFGHGIAPDGIPGGRDRPDDDQALAARPRGLSLRRVR